MQKKDWFEEWFDTEYYHILYKNRDDSEAQLFIQALQNKLEFTPDQSILDLACGKGRHTRFLSKLGLNASGCDLSQNSIAFAQEQSGNGIDFYVHDMRDALPKNYDVVLNLFTSFGYFDDLSDNLKVFQSVKKSLNKSGLFVIDFMNANKVISKLVASEVKTEEGIDFHISRKYTGTHIIKSIDFSDGGNEFHFEEKVQAVRLADFEHLADEAGFQLKSVFGNYQLAPFDANESDRLILVLQHG